MEKLQRAPNGDLMDIIWREEGDQQMCVEEDPSAFHSQGSNTSHALVHEGLSKATVA